MAELGLQDLVVFIGGTAIGLWIATRVEIRTGQCMLYYYDKIFHPNWFKKSMK